MSTRLEASQKKLERLKKDAKKEFELGLDEARKIPFGQPNIIGRGDIYKDAKKHYDKSKRLNEEIEIQTDKVEKYEAVDDFKKENELIKDVHVVGKSGFATIGAKTSVNNLDYFRNKLEELEQKNEEAKRLNKLCKPNEPKHKTHGTEITKLKNKISLLENLKQQASDRDSKINSKTKELIKNEKVTQWKKKPIYYFVKGLKKVALVINEKGSFEVSKKYPPKDKNEKEYVENLIKGNSKEKDVENYNNKYKCGDEENLLSEDEYKILIAFTISPYEDITIYNDKITYYPDVMDLIAYEPVEFDSFKTLYESSFKDRMIQNLGEFETSEMKSALITEGLFEKLLLTYDEFDIRVKELENEEIGMEL